MDKLELPLSLRSLRARRGRGCTTCYLVILSSIHNLVLVFATAPFQPALVEQRSADAARHFSKGVRLLSKRDRKRASGAFTEALKLDLQSAEAYSKSRMALVKLVYRAQVIDAVHTGLQ